MEAWANCICPKAQILFQTPEKLNNVKVVIEFKQERLSDVTNIHIYI
jgi:hypothetical protein